MVRLAVLGLVVTAVSLSAAPREEEAKKYAADLKNKDSKVRLTAVKELGRLGQLQRRLTEPYVDNIIAVLKDSDAKVRGEAGRTLGLIDPPEPKAAIEKLADLLKAEKSQEAREGFETGLGELGGSADDAELKRAARQALLEARKMANDKREQKVIQAAILLISGPKKKN
jgi:HEAT repeat protein